MDCSSCNQSQLLLFRKCEVHVSQAGIAVRAGLNHNLLGIAVRAVLLESGFVEIDPISKSLNSDKFNFQRNWKGAGSMETFFLISLNPSLLFSSLLLGFHLSPSRTEN
ncbi:hypothetical protein L1987_57189 [Smallanthus sonchifolius]|uniref:Uncharacterized protein n=1 Tax=Smallanthus sonchifolius TaxID=185202 RepID=A0ACB9DBV3_9ASTR|nr:hypothetical protein L1987_57189 [Smallanthus sonchifolius]